MSDASVHLTPTVLARLGLWLRDHQAEIRAVQWIVIGIYVFLLVAPTLVPLPTRFDHIWSNVALFAQFAFWGVWWPGVLLSMILVGRSWCGFFCPEGTLTEVASRFSRGYAVPRWLTWKGWPFVAFAGTTIYGQMVSVYQYPKPVLIVLGGSTVAAIIVGLMYGRDKRVWCRYMCPVNGVFQLLAKLAPFHYRVDRDVWDAHKHIDKSDGVGVNCAPLVPIRTMQSTSACHMCGRCAGFKDAVTLETRSPSHEIVSVAGSDPKPWETLLIIYGLIGLAAGAFQWNASPYFVAAKQALAEWFLDHDLSVLLDPVMPWWILTNYPEHNDVMTPLDGGVMVLYILATMVLSGTAVLLFVGLAVRALGGFTLARLHHMAQALIPIAGCGVFLGLSGITVTLLKGEGVDMGFIDNLRAVLLAGASVWCLWLTWKITRTAGAALPRRLAATLAMVGALMVANANWVLLFWIW